MNQYTQNNFASSQTCTVFAPVKMDCSCAVFGTPTTTPTPLTPNPLINYCKTSASSCKQTCARFKFSATQSCRITKPKIVVCNCSWFKQAASQGLIISDILKFVFIFAYFLNIMLEKILKLQQIKTAMLVKRKSMLH